MGDTGELFEKFVEIIAKLRDPKDGCPWDIKQTHESLKKYLIEETYETIDAIESDRKELPQELGDVLLQVVLHSQIGTDEGTFQIDDVIKAISKKMIERHPHVFSDRKVDGVGDVLKNWEEIKQAEKPSSQGLLDNLPKSLPALSTADRIGDKVRRIGFDWPELEGVIEKVEEEYQEMKAEVVAEQPDRDKVAEEFGDYLFSLAQLARQLEFDPEELLRKANQKFIRRFEHMEQNSDCPLSEKSADELQVLWEKAKREL